MKSRTFTAVAVAFVETALPAEFKTLTFRVAPKRPRGNREGPTPGEPAPARGKPTTGEPAAA
jgi:hypothetical protein